MMAGLQHHLCVESFLWPDGAGGISVLDAYSGGLGADIHGCLMLFDFVQPDEL